MNTTGQPKHCSTEGPMRSGASRSREEWRNEPLPVYQGIREFQLPFELDVIQDRAPGDEHPDELGIILGNLSKG